VGLDARGFVNSLKRYGAEFKIQGLGFRVVGTGFQGLGPRMVGIGLKGLGLQAPVDDARAKICDVVVAALRMNSNAAWIPEPRPTLLRDPRRGSTEGHNLPPSLHEAQNLYPPISRVADDDFEATGCDGYAPRLEEVPRL